MKRLLILAAIAALSICLGARAANEDKTWMVVDLRTGALSYYGYDLTTATNTFNTPLYKTEKMVFRRIPAGLYWVRDGVARAFMENDYYMAMFTVTVGQYAIITNSAAVVDQNDAENLKPQVEVAWQQWEGTSDLGNCFPNKASTGPIGQIEQRIHSNAPDTQAWLSMDLPTISMWEVAARAMPANDGSHKSWRWYFGETADDIDLYEWRYNAYGAIYKPVGSFLPNDWGFYDILGNGGQWCLDGIAEWPIGDEIYHYSQRPCRRAYSRGAAPYGWMSFWELKDDGERVLHEWGNDEAWGYRCYCGNAIEDSSAIGFHEICSSLGQNFSDRPTWRSGARLAIVCRNEVSAPPVTVTWQDDDGNVIEVDAVPFGTMPSYGGATPTKPSTVYGTYEFTGWTPQIGLAVSNTTYTAKFDSHTIYYAIKWLNWDGTELYADSHWYGYSPGYYGPAPTKPPTVEYEYTFIGWNPEPAAVTGETTYVAQFMQSARKYDITWLNYDGSTNATTRTPYNTIPEFAGETPAKPADMQYTYSFAGWTPELEPATSNTAYTAVFEASPREYTISWQKWDGTELFTTNVPYGSTPVYLGATPTQPSTAQYDYTFFGWDREIEPVTKATTYRAMFTGVLRSYDITWVNYDGTVLCVTNMPYGATPAYNGATPTKPYPADPHYGYSFTGWTPEVSSVTGTTTYTANFVLKLCDWMVVDLRTGSISEYAYDLATATNTFNAPLYKTEKMVFRRVPEGLYYVRNGASVAVMGRPYYVGMFPVTVAQYNLMLDPSAAVSETAENLRAVVNVSYATLRGSENVPTAFGGGLGDGPISRLNTRVAAKLGPFDLPTESMWEVAARAIEAGDETHKTWPWFFGASDSLLSQYAFFNGSSEADAYGITSGSRVPGGKLANAWGLFDIYGNVWERCLDSCPSGQSSETMSLLQVPQSGYPNVRQLGGSFGNGSDRCRTSDGGGWQAVTGTAERSGFRLAMISDELPPRTVTWVNYDGTVLEIDEYMVPGQMPTYDGTKPLKEASYPLVCYSFNGWTPTVEPFSSNATYTATFETVAWNVFDLSNLTADYTAQNGDVLTGETSQRVTIAADATVALAGISIKNHLDWGDSAMTCAGTATLIIADNTVNTIGGTLCAGGAGTTLTIQGNIGSLVVNGSDHSAGIGGKYNSACGDIVINGGVITVTGGSQGAGIGPGFDNNSSRDSSCGNITINGGTISVTGGDCCAGIGASNTQPCGNITINGGKVTAVAVSQAPGIGGGWYGCGNIAIAGGKVFATGKYYWHSSRNTCISGAGIGWNCSDVTIASTIEKVVASIDIGTPVKSQNGMVTIAESLKQTQEGNTLTIEPEIKETTVTVGGSAVGEVVRGEDGMTLSFAVAAGTVADDVKLDIGGVDVTKGFRVTVNGTEARAVLLAPYEVPKEEGAADGIWTENGDGTVTLNVTVVPGLYYAADSAESLDALACPGASAPATGETTLTAPKPVGEKGFFKVWVSDAPIPATP